MKKQKTITISLPKPCEEDWEQMTPVGCGRFCQQCQKNVIDFTALPDDMIARLLNSRAKGQLCGRFSEEQLNRPIPLPATPQKNLSHYLGTAAVFLAPYFSASPALARQETKMALNEKDADATNAQPVTIKGRISDALTKEPMIRMELSIAGLDKQYSDRHGRFSFTLPDDWTGRQITIRADYRPLSTTPKENTIILEETIMIEAGKKAYEVALMRYPGGTSFSDTVVIATRSPIYRTLGGAIVTTHVTTIKPSLWRRIAWFFKFKKRNR